MERMVEIVNNVDKQYDGKFVVVRTDDNNTEIEELVRCGTPFHLEFDYDQIMCPKCMLEFSEGKTEMYCLSLLYLSDAHTKWFGNFWCCGMCYSHRWQKDDGK